MHTQLHNHLNTLVHPMNNPKKQNAQRLSYLHSIRIPEADLHQNIFMKSLYPVTTFLMKSLGGYAVPCFVFGLSIHFAGLLAWEMVPPADAFSLYQE